MHKSLVGKDTRLPAVEERAFRIWLKRHWGKAVPSYVEAARGSTPGVPDVQLLLPGLSLPLPVELKVGVFKRYDRGRIMPRHLRADQISWHDAMARRGGKTCILLGLAQSWAGTQFRWNGEFDVYAQLDCRHEILKDWRAGWPVDTLTRLIWDEAGLDFDALKTCMALGQPLQGSQDVAGALKGLPR